MNRALKYINNAIGLLTIVLIIWCAIKPAAFPIIVGMAIFCYVCSTGMVFGDANYTDSKEEQKQKNERQGLSILGYLNFVIPIIVLVKKWIKGDGIVNERTFVIALIVFLILLAVMVAVIIKNCQRDVGAALLGKEILVVVWIIYLAMNFWILNYYCDHDYVERTVSVTMGENLPNRSGYTQEYLFYNEKGELETWNDSYMFKNKYYTKITFREGVGVFGVAYKNVFIEGCSE